MDKKIKAPIDKETAKSLKAGDYVYIDGIIYTARDAAHKRMTETLERGEALPIDIEGNVIYYMGPSRSKTQRFIIWDLHLQERDGRSVLRVRPQPAVWTNILQDSLIWEWEP